MTHFISILTLLLTLNLFGQKLPEYKPSNVDTNIFSEDMVKNFNSEESMKKCSSIWENWQKEERNFKQATNEELESLKYCEETKGSVWDAEGGGCSWYCAGGPDSITSSSFLSSQGDNDYSPSNAHDLSYKSVWCEGVEGYGVGEYLEYHFKPTSPRINKIIIANGYSKSQSAWKNNSRVKQLKVYIDNKPLCILNLQDIRGIQYFDVPLIGNSDSNKLRTNNFYENNSSKPNWKLKFEILDIYKGLKYDDSVISEIFFDGIDVHCFAKGTRITLADGTEKRIELLSIKDSVLSYNTNTNKFSPSKIKKVASPYHDKLIKIHLSNGDTITCTEDHPFLSSTNRFLSYSPLNTNNLYDFENVEQLMVGSLLKYLTGTVSILKIEQMTTMIQTYTIVELENGNIFIANGVLVGTEKLNKNITLANRVFKK